LPFKAVTAEEVGKVKKRVHSTLALVVAPIVLVGLVLIRPVNALAAGKVDCDKVMELLNSGKKTREVASEMHISRSSVYRCRKKARKAAKKVEEKAPATPAASPSP
jgi:DNA invertase Pin-like site-specific DNA recombinase